MEPTKIEPNKIEPTKIEPTKMESSKIETTNKVGPLLQTEINSECQTIYLQTMKFFEGKSSQKCIFPFIMNGEVYNGCINMDAATGSALANEYNKLGLMCVSTYQF